MDLEKIKKIAGITETVSPVGSKKVLNESMQAVRKAAGMSLLEVAGDEYYDKEEDEHEETDEEYNARMKRRAEKLGVPFKPRGAAASDKKPEPKKDDKPAASAGAKKGGKAPNPSSKSGTLRTWIENHPGVTRAEAWKHAVSVFGEKSEENPGGITHAGFSTLYQNARHHHGLVKKKEVKEAWVIMHPSIHNHILHENRELNQFQWVHFLSDNQEPMIFETEEEALKVATYLRDFRNQSVVIEHVNIDNFDEEIED